MHFAQTLYPQLKPLSRLQDLTQDENYLAIPDDWHIVLSDVRGSTKAIEAGKYREVNAVAAAMIAAILNKAGETLGDVDLPFVFGGDGATILVPADLREKSAEALIATRQLAQQAFELDLRIGIVPVADVRRAGHEVRVAKLHISDNFQQAIFRGGGLQEAENWLKDPDKSEYLLGDDDQAQADFSGFECRWQEIPSPQEDIVSLIVEAHPNAPEDIFVRVLNDIDEIVGGRDKRHPLTLRNLRLKWLPQGFITERKIRMGEIHWRDLFKTAYNTLLARIAMWFNIGQWGEYKRFLVESTDHEKFDDVLRMTIACTRQQRNALLEALDAHENVDDVRYGVHISQKSLVTCIVYDYFGRQVHFVDGAGGGYALAAKMLKLKLGKL
jgi:hypothetical protein